MNGQELQKQRKVVLAVSGFLIFLSLLGTIDVRNLNYAGYTLGPDNVFTAVTEGSPAEQAGMQVGDQLLSINDIDADGCKNIIWPKCVSCVIEITYIYRAEQ